MNNGQRAGEGALTIDVEQRKSYYWCGYGKVLSSYFVMASITKSNIANQNRTTILIR